MHRRLTDILVFLLAAALGFYAAGLIAVLGARFGWLPDFPAGGAQIAALRGKFQMASLVWMLGIIVGFAGFLPALRPQRYWLLLLPMYLPAFYTALVFVYFNFLPKS